MAGARLSLQAISGLPRVDSRPISLTRRIAREGKHDHGHRSLPARAAGTGERVHRQHPAKELRPGKAPAGRGGRWTRLASSTLVGARHRTSELLDHRRGGRPSDLDTRSRWRWSRPEASCARSRVRAEFQRDGFTGPFCLLSAAPRNRDLGRPPCRGRWSQPGSRSGCWGPRRPPRTEPTGPATSLKRSSRLAVKMRERAITLTMIAY